MENPKETDTRPDLAAHCENIATGMETTIKLMENYLLLREYAQKGINGLPESQPCESGAILTALQRSRDDTAIVVGKIDAALAAVYVAAGNEGCGYKVEAFERHYIQGQTYEYIADVMNAGRNSPARWCKEIMRQMAVRLFGVNGIGR